jgi:hypothetical protein
MVIDGTTEASARLAVVSLEAGRIRLPKAIGVQAGLTGEGPVPGWLMVVTPGRLRLLWRPSVGNSADFLRIMALWEGTAARGELLDLTASNERAALGARLIETSASPHNSGWRVAIPEEAIRLVRDGDERFLFALVVAGYAEIWSPDTLRRALSVPLDEVLR